MMNFGNMPVILWDYPDKENPKGTIIKSVGNNQKTPSVKYIKAIFEE